MLINVNGNVVNHLVGLWLIQTPFSLNETYAKMSGVSDFNVVYTETLYQYDKVVCVKWCLLYS